MKCNVHHEIFYFLYIKRSSQNMFVSTQNVNIWQQMFALVQTILKMEDACTVRLILQFLHEKSFSLIFLYISSNLIPYPDS